MKGVRINKALISTNQAGINLGNQIRYSVNISLWNSVLFSVLIQTLSQPDALQNFWCKKFQKKILDMSCYKKSCNCQSTESNLTCSPVNSPLYSTSCSSPTSMPRNPCRKVSKPKKGEPPCGCAYGCPCKAACYDWNPCMKPLN